MVQYLINMHMYSRVAEHRKGGGSLACVGETEIARTNKIIIIGKSCASIAQHIA